MDVRHKQTDEETDESQSSGETHVDWDARDHWLDARPGHGVHSRSEDWAREQHRRVGNDGRSATNTTFYGEDGDHEGPKMANGDDDRRSWDHLAKVNDGMFSRLEDRSTANFEADKRRWIETFGDRVGATEYHRSATEHVLEQIDPGPYQAAHITSECLILGVMSFFVDRDIVIRADETPEDAMNRRFIEREGTQQLLADLELTRTDIVQTRDLLRKNDRDLIDPQ